MPRTLSLTTLVTVELLKALCSVSMNTSLLSTGPSSNPYLVLGVSIPFMIYLFLVYSERLHLPILAESFGLAPLETEHWFLIMALSLPIIVLDEILVKLNVQSVHEKLLK